MSDKGYSELSVKEIENNLQSDIKEHKKKVIKLTIIAVVVLCFIFRGAISYCIKFAIANPSEFTIEKIDTSKDPVQIDYTPQQQAEKTFTYHSLINKNKAEIIPQAHYELSGRAIAINHDFLFISKFFDSVAIYDLGAAWGDMTDKKLYKKYIKIYSAKTELTGARRLHWSWKRDTPYTGSYISSHLSHTHIIPANRNIMAAMLKLKKFDVFKLEGELVDMNYHDPKTGQTQSYHTSLSRTDSDASSRGSGACETLYVTKVQIGHRIYK